MEVTDEQLMQLAPQLMPDLSPEQFVQMIDQLAEQFELNRIEAVMLLRRVAIQSKNELGGQPEVSENPPERFSGLRQTVQ